jgi:hypothetical protein
MTITQVQVCINMLKERINFLFFTWRVIPASKVHFEYMRFELRDGVCLYIYTGIRVGIVI